MKVWLVRGSATLSVAALGRKLPCSVIPKKPEFGLSKRDFSGRLKVTPEKNGSLTLYADR